MNKDIMATWPKDLETGLPMVPPGEFTDFSQYPNSKQPARVRKLPVLRGWFDNNRFDLDPKLPSHTGWGTVPLDRATALTFRVQRGPNVLYWLADPSDPYVWAAIDTWAAAKTIVLAAEFQDGEVLIVHRDFNLHPSLSAMRHAIGDSSHTRNFAAEASTILAKDEVKTFASSDIPSYPQLKHVQACMVRTAETGGVTVALHEGGPGPNGPMADSVSTLLQSMLKPSERRH